MREVLTGLSFLHERHIIHRDIKASNILLTEEYGVKISDFGIAGSGLFERNTMCGTVYSMVKTMALTITKWKL